jgi:hypothetical protein
MKTPKVVKTPAPVTPAPTAPAKPVAKKTSKAREKALKSPVVKAEPVKALPLPKPLPLPVVKAPVVKPSAATHRTPSAKGSEAAKKAWVTIRANRAAAALLLAAKPAGKKAVAKG